MYKVLRERKHKKVRKKIAGTKDCPRLSVFRSVQHISAQLIDDQIGKTLTAVSDIKLGKNQKTKKAYEAGKKIAEQALKLKIKKVVFDRGGFLYHGRVAEFAKGARDGGLEF
ncbi:MAG: 50S ribosomal protein L18 [Candidatus Daviesbacteria bacterium]|nr:50S ribosomal protein L18 [Candidatus Daviesbacteria bacterium]